MNTSDTDLLAIQAKVEETIEKCLSSDIGDIFLVIDLIKSMESRLKELRSQVTELAINRLKIAGATKPGKAIIIGGMMRWAGASKETKSINLQATAEGMMKATGGDWQRFTDCLSTSAFKPGECRKAIAASIVKDVFFDKLFVTTEKWKLDEKDAPVAALQEINLAFLK